MVEGEEQKPEKQRAPSAPKSPEAVRRERQEPMRKAVTGPQDSHYGVTRATDGGVIVTASVTRA